MTEAESPANPLGRSSAFTVTLPFLLSISVPYSICVLFKRQYNAKLLGENPVKLLEKELAQINKAINNILKAIEQGIITDTTKERLQELEATRRELQEKLIFERMQEQVVLDKKTIADYLKEAVKKEPEMMIDLLVDKVDVHEDRMN